MKANYKKLGPYIRAVKEKNNLGSSYELMGVNIDKFFMPSVANIVGTDLSKYKVVKPGHFACNRMHVGRDERLPVALSREVGNIIVSPAYDVFEVIDEKELLSEYLMMWFSRKEFDRNTWFHTDADVRGGLPWEDFYDLELPIPSIEKQKEIVAEYNTIVNRIKLNEQINRKLEETAQAIYKQWFVDFEFPISKESATEIGKPELKGQPYKSSGGKMVWNDELDQEIPAKWEPGSILDMFELQRGFDLPIQKRIQGNVPIYAANGLSDYHSKAKVKAPAVITGRSGTIGNVFYTSKECWPLNTTLWVKNFNLAKPILAYFILKNTELKGLHSGSAVPTLNRNDIHELPTVKPHAYVVELFELIIGKLFNQTGILVSEINSLTSLSGILLSKMSKAEATA